MFEVLVVEDTEEYKRIVSRTLSHCAITCAGDVDEAWVALKRKQFDLIVLDLGLPKRDGQSLLQELHDDPSFSKIPVICLTGRSAVSDKIAAFSLGAEDYIVKPFDPLEFRARVDAKITRNIKVRDTRITRAGPIEIDASTHRVFVHEKSGAREVALTQTEFKLLQHFMTKPERVFTRDQLLVAAWGSDAKVLDRVVDTHVCGLRKKLGDLGKAIKAVPSVGYKFVPPSAARAVS